MESHNPFAPSQATSTPPQSWQAAPGNSAIPVRTTGITVILVLFIIFGSLGVLGGIGAAMSLVFEDFLRGLSNPQKNPLVEKMQEIQMTFRLPGLIFAGANTLLSLLLLVAAAGLATRKRWGWSMGRAACKMGMVFEVFRLVLGIAQQGYTAMQVSTINASDMGPDVPEQAAQVMAATMAVGMVFGIVMSLVYAIGKMVIYYFSNRHLGKPEIAGLFD